MMSTMSRRNDLQARELFLPVFLLAAIAFSGCGGASEQDSASPTNPANTSAATDGALSPAETYRAVIVALGPKLLDAVDEGTQSDAMLSGQSAQVSRLLEAAKSPTCDFGVDYSAGLNILLPHLAQQRQLARVLIADAARVNAAGDKDGAARRVAAVQRMAAQIGGSAQCTIEFLVAIAIAELANGFVQGNPALAEAQWKTDIQQALLDSDRQVHRRVAEILRREGEVFAAWLRATSDSEYALAVKNTGIKPRSRDQRLAAADALEALNAEVAAAWGTSSAPEASASRERAKSKGIDDLAINLDAIRTAASKAQASARATSKALAGQ
jgi:hypothetical protein